MDLSGLTPKDMDAFYEGQMDEMVWYVFRNERHFGPFSIQWLQELMSLGALDESHYLWQPKLSKWKRIRDFENLKSYGQGVESQRLSDNDFESILQAAEFKRGQKPIDDAFDSVHLNAMESGLLDVSTDKETFTVDKSRTIEHSIKKMQFTFKTISLKQKLTLGLLTAVLMLTVVILQFFGIQLTAKEKQILSHVSQGERERINSVINSDQEQVGLKVALFSVVENGKSHIYLAKNDKSLNSYTLKLKGLGNSLIGFQRWSKDFSLSTGSYIQPITNQFVAGGHVPEGHYSFQINCQKCDLTSESNWKFMPLGRASYDEKLKQYQSSVKSQRILEIDELKAIYQKIAEHFQFTIGEFRKFTKSNSASRSRAWKSHVKNWEADQAKFQEVFKSLDSLEFSNQLIYMQEYMELYSISNKINELQRKQQNLFANRKVSGVVETASSVRNIKKNLDKIEKKLANLL